MLHERNGGPSGEALRAAGAVWVPHLTPCTAELSPKASCNWLPLFTERFSIELVNQSGNQASVYIVFR